MAEPPDSERRGPDSASRGTDPASRRRFLAVACATALAGCPSTSNDDGSADDGHDDDTTRADDGTGSPDDRGASPDWDVPSGSPLETPVEAVPLVVDLEVPWDLAFTPSGDLFVTERSGRLLRFDAAAVLDAGGDPLSPDDLSGDRRLPWPGEHMQGIAVHPSYPDPSHVYVYYGADGENRVGRFDAEADDPVSTLEALVGGIQMGPGIGGRVAFGPGGDLWITAGTNQGDPAQDPTSPSGSILRATPDGDPSPANPDLDGADEHVFTYGHRNPQGLAWLPDGTPLCTDHGPTGRDEVQRLRAGANYGWPVARGGPEAPEYGHYGGHDDFDPPLVNTGPDETWAPCGCVFYEADDVPAWRNRLLVGTLRGRHVDVVTLLPPEADQPPLDGPARRFDAPWLDGTYTATAHRVLAEEIGRVRHVTAAPDGAILALTSNTDGYSQVEEFPRERDDVLVRIRPA